MGRRRTVGCRERFSSLVQKAIDLGDGSHRIKVEKVLDIGGVSPCQPNVAIIKDDQNRVLLIPEDMKCDNHNRLASRWNVKKNMDLFLTVEGGKISDVFIGD